MHIRPIPTPTSRRHRRTLLALCIVAMALAGCGERGVENSGSTASDHLARSETYRQQRQYRAATIEVQNALQQAPQDSAALLQAATILIELGQGRRAVELLEPLAAGSEQPEVRLALTEAYLLQHKYESALRQVEQSGASIPAELQSRAQRMRGEALLGLGQLDQAERTLQQVTQPGEEALKARLALVRLDFQRGQPERGQQNLQKLLQENPDAVPVLTLAASIAERNNQLERAEELLTHAMMQLPDADLMTPDKTMVLRGLADILTRLGRTSEAMIYSKSLANANPEGAALQEKFNRGFELFQQGEHEEAEALLQEVYDNSRSELAGTLLGLIKYARQDLAGAADYLGRSVDPEVASDEVLLALASTQLRLDQPTRLLELIDPAQSSRLKNPELKALIGIALLETGDTTRGEQLINDARSEAPASRPITALLARHYLSRGQPQRAVDVLSPSVQQSGDPTLRQLLISAQLASDHGDAAIATARQLADQEPTSAQHQLALGRTALAAKRIDLARRALQRALELDPALTAARLNLAQIDLIERDGDRAAVSYRALVSDNRDSIAALKGLISAEELRSGKPAAGSRAMEVKVFAVSDTPTARAVLVEYYLRNQRLADAERLLPDTEGTAPNYLHSVQQLYATVRASAALNTRDYDAARSALLTGLATNPDDRQLTALLAATEIRAGQLKEAEKIIAQLEGSRGAIPVVTELKGDLQAASNQPTRAAELYRTLWQRQPNDQLAAKLHGQLQRTDPKAAAAFLTEWQQRLPDSLQPLMLEAMQLQEQGNNREAIARYEQLLRRSPDNVVAMNNIALLYGPADKRALPLAQKAASLAPESAAVLDTYGWLLLKNGDAKGAVEILEKAAMLAPDVKEIAAHLEEAKAKL